MRHFKSIKEYDKAVDDAIMSIKWSKYYPTETASNVLLSLITKLNDNKIQDSDINKIAEEMFDIINFDVNEYSCGIRDPRKGYEELMIKDKIPELLKEIIRSYLEDNTDFLWAILAKLKTYKYIMRI